jgi:type 1 glutamine amidotransferase
MLRKFVSIILLMLLVISCGSTEKKKILVFTRNGEGYVHDNIDSSVESIKKLGLENGFEVDITEDPEAFTEENLKQYDAVIYSNTNNKVFDTDAQKLALVRYTEAGGGFVGIHSACAMERDWPWMWKMVGGKFVRHAPFQTFNMKIIDANHPSTSFFTGDWERADECYYVNNINPDIHVLIAVDLNSVEDQGKVEYPGNTFGDLFPLVWYHEYDGGRQWFTALGHSKEDYTMPLFKKHLLGGILWAMENGKPDFTKAYSKKIK